MRTYGEYCALARTLDVIGQRWSLLIVRELLLRGPCRYTDLQSGLPGIATNLLADRVRELEQAGIIRREAAAPPIATTLFHLTERGEQLRPVVAELARWGAPLMAEIGAHHFFRSHWLLMPTDLYLHDSAPDGPPITIVVRADDQDPLVIETVDGNVRSRLGTTDDPDAEIAGTPELIVGLLFGPLTLQRARAHGLTYRGDTALLRRLRPASTHRHGDPQPKPADK